MLPSLNYMTGAAILAADGGIGSVTDFFLDDLTWTVRYLVVDAGNVLARRKVLIATTAVDEPDWEKRIFPVQLTKEQVRHSPDVDTDKPISRQQEIAMSRYFGRPTYWSVRVPAGRYTTEMQYPTAAEDNPHLRSVWAIAGYDVWATDGEIGRVDGFIIDEAGWHVGYIVVAAGSWLNSQNLRVSRRWVESVSWGNRRVNMANVRAKGRVRAAPFTLEFEPQRHLHGARVHHALKLAERQRRCQREARVREIRMVEQIERLGAKLQPHPFFGQAERFRERQVSVE
jgi:hypothetical protein